MLRPIIPTIASTITAVMIHIARIHLGAVLQKKLRNLHCRSKMQRRLSVSAPRVHNLRIRGHQLTQLWHHSQPRSRVRIHLRTAFDQKIN